MSRAVVVLSGSGRPEALRKVVRVMPMARARMVISWPKRSSLPARCSPTAAATSFALFVTSARIACSTDSVAPTGRPSFDGGRDAASSLMRIGVLSWTRPSCSASNSM
ncbi:hypothetical protein ROS9278_04910 [Roseomonas sp. CECT 9278]|nr:hypothetical protein ROS9278_04910 [Roseomonas sp. CECT 9278]